MAEMVQPKYGYDVIKHADHIEVRYDQVGGGKGSVAVYPDRVRVGNKDYSRDHIGSVYAKTPDRIVKEMGHVPPQVITGGPLMRLSQILGSAVGGMVKDREMERADNEEWSVWFIFGEAEKIPLAWGFGQARAKALEQLFTRLLHG
jgi:hypothetical protein